MTQIICLRNETGAIAVAVFFLILFSSISSVQSLSRVWLCGPMDCSTPGFPVHHQLPELAQTHVHQVSDAIQPSHPLFFSPSGSFPMSQFFTSGSQSIGALASVLPMMISFRIDWFDLLADQGTLKSLLQHHSSKIINSLVLSFLYNPTLTSIHDPWKNHSFD